VSSRKDKIEVGIAVAALVVAGVAAYYSYQANVLARDQAEKQGDFVVMESPVVNLWDPTTNGFKPFPATTPIPLEAWSAAGGLRTLTVKLRNEGQQEAHFGQPGIVTLLALTNSADTMFPHTGAVDTAYEDRNGLNPKCSHGGGDDEGQCAPVLAAHDAVLLTIDLPDAYLHKVDPAKREGGIIFSLFVGGDEKLLNTKIVLPAVAFGG
jgi:hypothetical protein